MKKVLFIVLIGMMFGTAWAQTEYADSTTSSGANDVFYSFREGILKVEPKDNWDIAFEIQGFMSSILINEAAGVELYKAPYADEDWSSFDTTGMTSWPRQFNSRESWAEGAFNRGLSSEFDLGWGQYDINTHQVKGDSVFLIKLRNGDWKKILIVSLAGGTYNFKFADVNGSNEKTSSLGKSSFSGKQFGYYSLTEDKSLDREPSGTPWDLVFTTYITPISMGGPVVYYPVYGVKTAPGVESAERRSVDVKNNDTMNANWTTEITNIGSDWKSYDGQQQTYTIVSDLSYFVKTELGDVWKIYFTGYTGGSEGKSLFNVTNISSSVSVAPVAMLNATTYPNPADSKINVTTGENLTNVRLEIIATNGQSVFNENYTQGSMFSADVSSFTAGFYIVKLTSEQGVYTSRISVR